MAIARFALSSLPVLALGACAPADEDEEKRAPPPPPIGFELAAASELRVREALGQTGSEVAERNASVVEIDAEALSAKLAQGNVRLIDVRRDDEVAEGVIPGAEHIAMDRFDPAQLDLSDGREVILYCRSGGRSSLMAEKLAAHTGEQALHLEGGILAWSAAGKSVERP